MSEYKEYINKKVINEDGREIYIHEEVSKSINYYIDWSREMLANISCSTGIPTSWLRNKG